MVRSFVRQQGASLIEVLVTVLIMVTALLALSALQLRSVQFSHSAYLRSQANILAYDIIDRIRINRINVASYSIAYDADAPSGGGLSAVDLREWRETIKKIMPDGLGQVECNAGGICTVSIRWSEQNQSGQNDEDAAEFKFTTRV